jgi:hypothetical protein
MGDVPVRYIGGNCFRTNFYSHTNGIGIWKWCNAFVLIVRVDTYLFVNEYEMNL